MKNNFFQFLSCLLFLKEHLRVKVLHFDVAKHNFFKDYSLLFSIRNLCLYPGSQNFLLGILLKYFMILGFTIGILYQFFFYGYHNKCHKLVVLNNRNSFLTVLEAGSLKSRCQYSLFFMKALRKCCLLVIYMTFSLCIFILSHLCTHLCVQTSLFIGYQS